MKILESMLGTAMIKDVVTELVSGVPYLRFNFTDNTFTRLNLADFGSLNAIAIINDTQNRANAQATTLSRINPSTPKDGDIKIDGTGFYIYMNVVGDPVVWRKIYPPVYGA